MYRERVRSKRQDALSNRDALEPTNQFGERISTDFVICPSSGKEHVVQVIRDEFSGWLRAYPITKRDTHVVVRNLLSFLGPSHNQPCIILSDQARETRLAPQQLGFNFEKEQ